VAGWDFSVLWAAGNAILEGQSPYDVANFFYPLPFAYFLAILALLPQQVSLLLWLALNIGLLILAFRREFWKWLPYAPFLHLLSSGQMGFLFWSLERGMSSTWRTPIFAALITLKPQAAIILLPWHILGWLRFDRKTALRFLLATGIIWGLPLTWSPEWPIEWWNSLPSNFMLSAANSPGVFSLTKLFPTVFPLAMVVAVSVFVWGQFQSKEIGRATAVLASPFGLFYSTIALIGCAPARLMTPASLVVVALTIISQSFIPFIILPLIVIAYNLDIDLQSVVRRLNLARLGS
jgi:hypothetical protein